jgi:hypothetical protein
MHRLSDALNLKYLGGRLRDDWPALLLMALLLFAATGSIVVADWADNLWLLPTFALIGLLVGYLLAISAFSELTLIGMSLVYGAFTIWATIAYRFLGEGLTFRQRLVEVATRVALWVEQAVEGGFSRDNLMFVALLGLVAWVLAFNAASNMFRSRRLWYAVIPPGIALLINTYYYFGPARMDLFLIVYLFLAFTLAVRTNVFMRERLWRRQRVGYTPGIRFDLVRAGVIAIVVVIAVAWSAPAASASNQLSAAWDRSINPWHRVQDTFQRLFGGVEGGSTVTADYYGGQTLTLGGPVNLTNATVMYVYAPQGYRYYWQSKIFDTYEDGKWVSNSDARLSSEFGILGGETGQTGEGSGSYALRRNVQQRFELAIRASRLVYAAPLPVSFASLPVNYDVIYTVPGSQDYVDVTTIRAEEMLASGDSYTATSSISVADEASLRSAGTGYPAWVRERYLQLPPTITPRTAALAAQIAAPYDNPYDRARAIETYLRETITYNQAIDPPPSGADPVDHFLFESLEGYCNYYASAMVVMLRSQGIPARIAVGFAQGDRDPNLGAFRVAESDAHSWVQAYFPGYGWIEFEPTTIIEPIVRPAVRPPSFGVAPPPNEQRPDGGDAPPDERLPDGGLESEEQPLDRSLWGLIQRFRIPAFVWGAGLLAVVAGAGVVGAWFWLEQRGLAGLSDVSRSYARLNVYAPWVGVRLDESATPYERADRLGWNVPEGEGHIDQIAGLYVQEQYGPPPETPLHLDRANTLAREEWEALRPVFMRHAAFGWLRRLLPGKRGQSG